MWRKIFKNTIAWSKNNTGTAVKWIKYSQLNSHTVGLSKEHSVNIITIIMLGREFETVGPWSKVISYGWLVCSGKRTWRRWFEERVTELNNVSSASSASWATVDRSVWYNPEHRALRRKDSRRCLSAAVVNPHHALDAYMSLAIITAL